MKEQTERALFWWVMIVSLALFWGAITYALYPAVAEAQVWSRDTSFVWNPNAEADLKEYVLYRNGVEVDRIPAGTEAATTTVTEPGTFEYYITAVDTSLNESGESNRVSVTLDDVSPENPIQLTINISVSVTINP